MIRPEREGLHFEDRMEIMSKKGYYYALRA
jgi:hypothetical protein